MSRLKSIVEARGGVLLDGGRRALIRGPGHGPGDLSVSLRETEYGRILIHCFSPRDDWRSVRDQLIAERLLDRSRREVGAGRFASTALRGPPASDIAKLKRAKRIWSEGAPIGGSIAERYLRARAIMRPLPNTLRFHPAMTSLEDSRRRPAMIGAIAGGATALIGVHVTLLHTSGAAKARVAVPRRVIGRMMGGAVRLGEPIDTLIIAEGIETALSAQTVLDGPAWALISAANFARFEPPARVRRLVIAADRDEAGLRAAAALQRRLANGVSCDVALPPAGCKDWNDSLRLSEA